MARRVSGTSKLRRQLRRFPEETKEGLREELSAIGEELREAISVAAPKDEGDLSTAAHAQVSRDGLAVHVGYSANRSGFKRAWKAGGFTALWQEFGTQHHSAQPFISPAFRRLLPGAINRIDAAVDRVIKAAQNWGR